MAIPSFPVQPDRTWEVGAGFWEGVDAEELRFPKCSTCGRFVWYPLARCPECRTETLVWTAVDPVGEVYSFTRARRAFIPGFEDNLPHAVVLTRFPDAPGVTFITALADRDQGEEIAVGSPIRIVFPKVDGDHRLALVEVTS